MFYLVLRAGVEIVRQWTSFDFVGTVQEHLASPGNQFLIAVFIPQHIYYLFLFVYLLLKKVKGFPAVSDAAGVGLGGLTVMFSVEVGWE